MLDEVAKERDELQEKNARLLSFKRGASAKLGMASARLKREGAVLTVEDDSTWDSSKSTGRGKVGGRRGHRPVPALRGVRRGRGRR